MQGARPPTVDARLVATLERSFARMSGGDGVLDVKELQRALGLRSEYLAQINLASEPASAALASRFQQEIAARWDLATLDREVRLSQQRRLAIARALGTGVQTPWDFSPPYDAARRYIRNHMDLGDLEEMARFPPVRGRASSS